jgi:hypothetical protein
MSDTKQFPEHIKHGNEAIAEEARIAALEVAKEIDALMIRFEEEYPGSEFNFVLCLEGPGAYVTIHSKANIFALPTILDLAKDRIMEILNQEYRRGIMKQEYIKAMLASTDPNAPTN